ncbi:MAG: hypothetical protein MZV63_25720 [Marinilabiliales bacterium]|nr:hypothetical protein [Marinilabiliales bacterium]
MDEKTGSDNDHRPHRAGPRRRLRRRRPCWPSRSSRKNSRRPRPWPRTASST